MTAQAWSTRSSVPWEQGDIKSSGSRDPPMPLPIPKTHRMSWGWTWAGYPRQGSSVTRQEGSAPPKAVGVCSFPTVSYVPSVTAPQPLAAGPRQPSGGTC